MVFQPLPNAAVIGRHETDSPIHTTWYKGLIQHMHCVRTPSLNVADHDGDTGPIHIHMRIRVCIELCASCRNLRAKR